MSLYHPRGGWWGQERSDLTSITSTPYGGPHPSQGPAAPVDNEARIIEGPYLDTGQGGLM